MWFAIFSTPKLTKIKGNLSRFQFIKNRQNWENIKYLGQFSRHKGVDRILESSQDFQSFVDALNAIYQLSEIKDDI